MLQLHLTAEPDGRRWPLVDGDRLILPPLGAPPELELRLDGEPPPGSACTMRIELDGLIYAASECAVESAVWRQPVPGLLDAAPGTAATLQIELRCGWELIASSQLALRVPPLVVGSSLDPVEQVQVANAPRHDALARAIALTGVPLRRIGASSLHGAKVIGRQTWPAADGIAELAVPLPVDAGADPLSQLQVSPPCHDCAGRWFPHGRVLHGVHGELRPHPELLALLERQRLQWPPIAIDVAWLSSGDIRDVVQFVPSPSRPGFAALVPNPELAAAIVDDLPGPDPELRAAAGSAEQRTIGESLRSTREHLCRELGLAPGGDHFVDVPMLYRDGAPLWPCMVNCLVLGRHLILPDPHGPAPDGVDQFAEPVVAALRARGLVPVMVDEGVYHPVGESHGGVTVVRRLSSPDWWTVGDAAASARLERRPDGLEWLHRWLAAGAEEATIRVEGSAGGGWSVHIALDGRLARLNGRHGELASEAGAWAEWRLEAEAFRARCAPSLLGWVLSEFGRLMENSDDG